MKMMIMITSKREAVTSI